MTTTILSKLRDLLADDAAIMRTWVAGLLRQMGIHPMHEARDGKGALVKVIRFQPDLVRSDIHMEPMDGIALVKQLRALPLGIKASMIKAPRLEVMKAQIKAAMD